MTLSPATVTIPENQGTTTITATLSASSDVATTLNLGFTGTAVLGTNYDTLINGVKDAETLTIPAGTRPPRSRSSPSLTALRAEPDGVCGNQFGPERRFRRRFRDGHHHGGRSPAAGHPPPSTSTMAESGGSAIFTFALNEISGLDTTLVLGFGGTATLDKAYVSGHKVSRWDHAV